jgi:outer membrane protein assembly factor BamB
MSKLWCALLLSICAVAAPGHRFACADYTQGKVFVVDETGKVEWSYPAPNANDIWVLPSGNLLFNTGHGVKEVTRGGRVAFDYQSASEIYACQRLPNGDTFIGECNAGRLLEVDPAGRIVHQVRLLPEGRDGGSAYMRNARKLPNGNYLVAHYGLDVVREYDPAGKLVWQVAAPGGPHSVVRLPGGNTLIASADRDGAPARVFEAAPDGRTVWEVRDGDLPGIGLKFMTGLQRLPNGNTVMSNWLGHGQLGKAPHLIEVTRGKRVVWTFADHETMKTVSSVEILDAAGRPLAEPILH